MDSAHRETVRTVVSILRIDVPGIEVQIVRVVPGVRGTGPVVPIVAPARRKAVNVPCFLIYHPEHNAKNDKPPTNQHITYQQVKALNHHFSSYDANHRTSRSVLNHDNQSKFLINLF